MAEGSVAIFNAALGHIGEAATVAGPADRTDQALACKRFYPIARDGQLAEHPWRFAERTETLAEFPTVPQGWSFAYVAPTQQVAIRKVWCGTNGAGSGSGFAYFGAWGDGYGDGSCLGGYPIPGGIEWRLMGVTDDDGSERPIVATRLPATHATFTRRIEAEAQFPPLFTLALSWRLAWLVCKTLSKDEKTRGECWTQHLYWRSVAAAADQRQALEPAPEGDILCARV